MMLLKTVTLCVKVHPDHDTRTGSDPIDPSSFRLGEFYLNYAEALVESESWSANRQTALLYLNKIRERAGSHYTVMGQT